jgi:hypothetical protein
VSYTIKAHETRYAGHLFRSRLEARWAAMLDLLGWQWTYEPFDLNGWVPDFLLAPLTEQGSEVLVEVKGPASEWEAAKEKIERALGDRPQLCLLVGHAPFTDDDCWNIGHLFTFDISQPWSEEHAAAAFDYDQRELIQGGMKLNHSLEQIDECLAICKLRDCDRDEYIRNLTTYDPPEAHWEEAFLCTGDGGYTLHSLEDWQTLKGDEAKRLWGQAHEKTRYIPR